MKKSYLKVAAAAALAFTMVLAGCSNGTKPSITEIQTDSVTVTAKAYPGFNYVCWTKPVKYQGAAITILRDDGIWKTPASGVNYFVDSDVKDGVTYTYTAYVSNAGINIDYQFKGTAVTSLESVDTSLKGYVKLGNSASASCKAINPAGIKDGKLMTALDLCAYEPDGNKDYVLNEDNIIIEKEALGSNYYIAFPTKKYLSYYVNVYRDKDVAFEWNDKIEASDFTNVTASSSASTTYYTNDSVKRITSTVTNPGTYSAVIKVTAVNGNYQASYVTAKKTFTIETLDVKDATGTITAGYIDSGKTIRLIWKPATKKADGSNWSSKNYAVYVKNNFDSSYKEIFNGADVKTAKVGEDGKEVKDESGNVVYETKASEKPVLEGAQAGDVVYYVDYTVESNKITNNFTVVLSDNGKYESSNKTKAVNPYADATAASSNNVTVVFTDADNDGKANDARLTLTNASKDLKIKSAGYKIIDQNDNFTYEADNLILDSELKTTAVVPSADYTKYDVYAKDVPYGKKVVFLYVLSDLNKKDKAYVKSTTTTSGYDAFTLSEFTATYKEAAANTGDIYTVTLTLANKDDKAKYTYQAFYAKLDGNEASAAGITEWTAIELPALALNEGKTAFVASKEVTLPPSTVKSESANLEDTKKVYEDKFVFKFVKTLTGSTDAAATVVGYSDVKTVTVTK